MWEVLLKAYNNGSRFPSVAIAAWSVTRCPFPICNLAIYFPIQFWMFAVNERVRLQTIVNFSCSIEDKIPCEWMSAPNRITFRAYEHTFADRALASQNCFCFHGNQCREKCGILGWAYCNTSDFLAGFCKHRALDRANKVLWTNLGIEWKAAWPQTVLTWNSKDFVFTFFISHAASLFFY